MKYPGKVTVTFPFLYNRVVVEPYSSKGFFGTVSSWMSEKHKYEVVSSIWPYASSPDTTTVNGRRFAVQSEDDWWKSWRQAVQLAVKEKRRGWLSSEHRIEIAMDPDLIGKTIVWNDILGSWQTVPTNNQR